MGFILQLPSGKRIALLADAASIGRDPACDVALPRAAQVEPRHARIRKVANRWMIESEGDWLLQVGSGVPGRKLWLIPGEVIRLSETGPELVFRLEVAAAAGAADAGAAESRPVQSPAASSSPVAETAAGGPVEEEPAAEGGELAELFEELSGPAASESVPWISPLGQRAAPATDAAAAFPQFNDLDDVLAPLYREPPPLVEPKQDEQPPESGETKL